MKRCSMLWAAIALAIAVNATPAERARAGVISTENWEAYSLSRASPDLDGWDYVADVASPPWNTLDNLESVWIGNSKPGDFSYPASYSGEQFVDMNASYLWQNTGHAFVDGVTYTLSVQATAAVPGERLYMYIGDHNPVEGPDLGTSLAMDYFDVPDTNFDWNEYVLSYTATADDVGKELVFALYGRSATYIDDVVAMSSAPEPSSFAMGVIGLVGLTLAGRWRRRWKARAC